MCGISGGINITPEHIKNMVMGQLHRGPDGAGYSSNLGHNRLSIIDLSNNGSQPMQNERLSLTFNGEIYNYKELKTYLTEYEFKSDSDTEVLLNYIDKFGVYKLLKDAIGMFAFAVHDKLTDKLTLAVDQFSQKPIYWIHEGDKFAFASQPNVLMQFKSKWSLNERALQNYWTIGAPGHDFLLDGIHKLQGSHKLEFHKNKVIISRYWQPTFQSDTSEIEYFINDAIEKVKVSDVPVYLFLSGGIDSTVCATRMEGYKAIHLASQEQNYAREVALKCNLDLKIVRPEPHNAIECLTDAIKKTGVPGMATLVPYITSKYIDGKVGIIANGADELFYGYDRIVSPNVKKNNNQSQYKHLFRTDFLDYDNLHVPDIDEEFGVSGISRWLELNTFVQYDLNQTLDHASMCHSVEVRSPFLDHRLVEMALSISDTIHLQEHGNKSILKRKLLGKGFSNEFVNRPKIGFSLHTQPLGFDRLKQDAFNWCIAEGYLPKTKLESGRDKAYTMAAAASFMIWAKQYL